MIRNASCLPVVVTADNPHTLQEEVQAAVDIAKAVAIREGKHGVMVTRHSFTEFTVEVSAKVPYGTTMEAQWTGTVMPARSC